MSAFVPLIIAASGTVVPVIPLEVAEIVLAKLIADSPAKFVLCIQLDDHDPPASLIRKLQRSDRTVVLGSECHSWVDMNHPDYHTKTGRPAHFLSVSGFVERPAFVAQVQAVDHYNGKWAKFWTVRLMRSASGWEITSFHLDAEA